VLIHDNYDYDYVTMIGRDREKKGLKS
jgi:hypothetical protein